MSVEAGMERMVRDTISLVDIRGTLLRVAVVAGSSIALIGAFGMWCGSDAFVFVLLVGIVIALTSVGHLGLSRR